MQSKVDSSSCSTLFFNARRWHQVWLVCRHSQMRALELERELSTQSSKGLQYLSHHFQHSILILTLLYHTLSFSLFTRCPRKQESAKFGRRGVRRDIPDAAPSSAAPSTPRFHLSTACSAHAQACFYHISSSSSISFIFLFPSRSPATAPKSDTANNPATQYSLLLRFPVLTWGGQSPPSPVWRQVRIPVAIDCQKDLCPGTCFSCMARVLGYGC